MGITEASEDPIQELAVWNTRTGKHLGLLENEAGKINKKGEWEAIDNRPEISAPLFAMPDNRTIVAGYSLWRLQPSLHTLKHLPSNSDRFYLAPYTTKDSEVLSTNGKHFLEAWDVKTRKLKHRWRVVVNQDYFAYSPRSKVLASVTKNGTIAVWQL